MGYTEDDPLLGTNLYWECDACGHFNHKSLVRCEACQRNWLDAAVYPPASPDGWDAEDGDEPPEVPDLEVRG